MSVKWNNPGVQIEEVSLIPTTIVRTSTTRPLFIGHTFAHHGYFGFNAGSEIPTPATEVNSVAEFVQKFGNQAFAVYLDDELKTGNYINPVFRLVPNLLYLSIQHYFANGGGPCMVISNCSLGTNLMSRTFVYALQEAETVQDCQLLVMPEVHLLPEAEYKTVHEAALSHCARVGNRFFIADPPYSGNPQNDVKAIRDRVAGDNLRHGAAYYPHLTTTLSRDIDFNNLYVWHTTKNGSNYESGRHHWKKVKDVYQELKAPFDLAVAAYSGPVVLGASAAVAGQTTKTDRERGLWHAAANLSLNATSGPAVNLTQMEQDKMNVDASTGKSVNVIRTFPGRGTVVWGARTLDGNSPEWKYVPVRRLFTMAENGIRRGVEWAVFEPNDANTWTRLKSIIEIYLTGLWRDGALLGGKPQEAFFVRVGLGSTMTTKDILDGILRIEVGMAAVRPAEFIVLRISQMMQQS